MDKYYVYRPLLGLIGLFEGTDKGRGYNETLAYGKLVDGVRTKGKGPAVNLVEMTLEEVLALQQKMLKDPDNKWNSSAVGRYQIVGKTLRRIRAALPERYPLSRLYDQDCQDEMACFLLGQRGIDKWLAGRMKETTLINNLAKEWASFPTTEGKGYYPGQGGQHTVAEVQKALAEVKRRHRGGQPEVRVPEQAVDEVKTTRNWGVTGTGLFGLLSSFGSWILQADLKVVVFLALVGVVGCVVALLFGEYIIRRLRALTEAARNVA